MASRLGHAFAKKNAARASCGTGGGGRWAVRAGGECFRSARDRFLPPRSAGLGALPRGPSPLRPQAFTHSAGSSAVGGHLSQRKAPRRGRGGMSRRQLCITHAPEAGKAVPYAASCYDICTHKHRSRCTAKSDSNHAGVPGGAPALPAAGERSDDGGCPKWHHGAPRPQMARAGSNRRLCACHPPSPFCSGRHKSAPLASTAIWHNPGSVARGQASLARQAEPRARERTARRRRQRRRRCRALLEKRPEPPRGRCGPLPGARRCAVERSLALPFTRACCGGRSTCGRHQSPPRPRA